MWNYDYLIRMNKRYAILPMLHIAKVKFTAIAIAQDPDVARSQGIPLDNSTSSDDWFFTRLKSYDIMTWYIVATVVSLLTSTGEPDSSLESYHPSHSVALVHTCSYWWNSPFLGESSLASIKWPRLQQQACDN